MCRKVVYLSVCVWLRCVTRCVMSLISECNKDQFACDNGMCKPKYWVCDRVNDCGDESDEKQCSEYLRPPPLVCRLTARQRFAYSMLMLYYANTSIMLC